MTFSEFRDLFAAYRLPRIILTALELKLFTVMGSLAWTPPQLARSLKVSERGVTMLCRNLAMAGLLIKKGERYRTGRLGSTLLNGDHPAYRGSYIDLLAGQWNDWAALTESVRTGKPVDHGEPEQPDYRSRFTWAMHQRTMDLAPRLAAGISLKGAKSLLDLGGGPGTYALAFLARNRKLRGTVCDRPAALEVAKTIARSHKAGARLSCLPLDLLVDPIPGTYDVVWFSNVLHIYSPEQNRAVLRRIKAALNPGGRLLIQDAFLHDREGLRPDDASLFALSMLLFTETGDTYHATEVTAWLKAAGFEDVRLLKMKKTQEDWEGGVLEARVPRSPVQTRASRRRSIRS
ncbi:MAG: putative O-methyltransferase, family 2 [Nitrospira sp.]